MSLGASTSSKARMWGALEAAQETPQSLPCEVMGTSPDDMGLLALKTAWRFSLN